ncbi:MAG: tandem-95 repeat protein [Comamonadaceae bacterium]|nr:MAG: tandem-95 repeat protein [Comamonadaceae bacterium]
MLQPSDLEMIIFAAVAHASSKSVHPAWIGSCPRFSASGIKHMKVVRKHGGEVADATVETLSLEQPSIIHLRIAPESVSRFERHGADLALVLQDGSVTVLRGFFSVYPDNGRNDLVLEDDAGVMWWGQYTSPWTQFSFTEIEWLDAVAAVPVTDGLPGWLIAGLAVLGLGVAAGGGGGGGSAPPPVNRSPSADAHPVEVRVGHAGQGRVDARDPDGDALTYTVNKVPANGDVTIDPRTGEFVYTPRPGYVGTDSFEVIVNDGKGGTATVSVPVTVTNDAPMPTDPNAGLEPGDPAYVDGQTFDPQTGNYGITTLEDKPVVGKVVGNDADGDDLTYTKGSDPAHGTVVVNEDGTYTYTPGENFNGTDEFTVIVDDGHGGKTTSTVTVNVTPVNDAPIPTDPNAGLEPGHPGYHDGQTFDPQTGNYKITTLEDKPVAGKVVGSDEDGDDLTYTKGSDPTHGAVVVNEDGTYTYTPGENFNGTDEFTVIVDDGHGGKTTSTVTVNVTPVNDVPMATDPNEGLAPGDPLYLDGQTFDPQTGNYGVTTPEDTPFAGKVVGSDADGDVLTYTKGSNPAHGTVVVNEDGTYTYTPGNNFNGSDEFTVIVDDGHGGTKTSTVTVNVTPVNDAPDAVTDGPIAVTEDTPSIGNVLTNDTDPDVGTTLVVTKFTVGGVDYNAGTTATITGVGTLLINGNGTYAFTPALNYTGAVPGATYTVSDGTLTDTATLSFNITPVNDAPDAVNDGPIAVTEDTPATGNVLTNDTDPDAGTTLVVTKFTVGGADYNAGTTATITGVGTLLINSNGAFTFTPALNYTGAVPTATYTVSDGALIDTANLSFTITPVNDAPIATDPNGGLSPGDPGYQTGQTFDPQTGNYGVTTPEDTPFAGKVVGSDVDGDVLTYTKGSNPAHGTVVVNGNGTYTYTPTANYNGTDQFTVTVSDGKGGTTTSTVTVNVTPVNDAPDALNDGPIAVTEDTPATGNVLTNDTDPDAGTTLVVTKFTVGGADYNAGTTATITGVGTLLINGDGTFTFTPAPNYTGAVPSATYTVSDGTLTDTAVLSFTITPVNDAPIATDPNAGLDPGDPLYVDGQTFDPLTGKYSHTAVEDGSASGRVTGTDAEGDALTYAKGTDAAHGTVVVNGDGTYTYTPTANFSGTDAFTVTISDGKGGTTTSTVTVNVTPVTDAPAVVAQVDFNLTGTELTTHTWSNIKQVNANGTIYNLEENAGDGANDATLKGAIDYLMSQGGGVTGTTTTLTSATLPTSEAKLITGFMYLEVGKTYQFSGKVDDSGTLVIGDAAEAHVNWKGASTGVDSQFTVTTSGFYTFDLYLHNAQGEGNYNFNVVNADGSDVPLFGSLAQINNALVDGYMALNTFDDGADNDGKGFYELIEAYTHKSGQVAGEPIALAGVKASSTDLDGSETISMKLAGLPDGTVLTYTTHFADGSTGTGSATVQGGSVEVTGEAHVVSFDNLQVDVPDGVGGVHPVTMTVSVQDGDAAPKSSVVEFDVNSELNADPMPVARMSVQEAETSHAEDAAQHPQGHAADSTHSTDATDSDAVQMHPPAFAAESLGLANLDAAALQADEPQASKPVLTELLVTEPAESFDALLSSLPAASTGAVTGGGVAQPTSESAAYTPPVGNALDDDLHHANLMAA